MDSLAAAPEPARRTGMRLRHQRDCWSRRRWSMAATGARHQHSTSTGTRAMPPASGGTGRASQLACGRRDCSPLARCHRRTEWLCCATAAGVWPADSI